MRKSLPFVVSVLVVVLICCSAVSPALAEPNLPANGRWVRPVEGEVVRPFEAPATPYGPGHRGVDLAAAPGTAVRAAGRGVVSFAGQVAGVLHVVVAHEGGLRTSYSVLSDRTVSAGDAVSRGEVVGHTGGESPDHPAGRLHFGLREGDRYLDPMLLFVVTDLTELVRLVPITGEDGTSATSGPWPVLPDQRHLLREFGRPPAWMTEAEPPVAPGLPAADQAEPEPTDLAGEEEDDDDEWSAQPGRSREGSRGGGWLARGASAVASAVGRGGEQVARVGAAVRTVAGELPERWVDGMLRHVPGARALGDLFEMGERFADWVEHRRTCDAEAPGADGTGGSRHTLLAVAGIDSATGADGRTFGLDAEALGYLDDEVRFFSYEPEGDEGPEGDGRDYTKEDTWVDVFVAAESLGGQLRDMQRRQPGREVDLIAHSYGGVVVDVFLQYLYVPGDEAYPPLGTVVTLSSPHEGAPLATALDRVDDTGIGRVVLDGLGAQRLGIPRGEALDQLSERSELMKRLWDRGYDARLDVTSIGATDDVIVPANRTEARGAESITVAVDGIDDHGGIASDPDALRAVRAALEQRPMPCVGWVDGLRGAITPVVISRVETTVGELLGGDPFIPLIP